MISNALEIAPGIYAVHDAGGGWTMHVDLAAVCEYLGMEPTPKNMLLAQQVVALAIRQIIGEDVPMGLTTSPCPFQSDPEPKGGNDVDDNEETENRPQTGRRPGEGQRQDPGPGRPADR